jgi:hypothetical protein
MFKPASHPVPVTLREVDALIGKQYLSWKNQWPNPSFSLVLMDSGRKYFQSASGASVGGRVTRSLFVVPIAPTRLKVVEVTGITDGENGSKLVEFRWQFDASSQPDEVKSMLSSLTTVYDGKAHFKLYDDGWRATIDDSAAATRTSRGRRRN